MFKYFISIVILIYAYLALLAEFDLFYSWLILLGIIVIVIFLSLKIIKEKINLRIIDLPAYILILIISLYTSIFFHDNFYGSRDPGLYLNNAVYLARNHTLKLPRDLNTHVIVYSTYNHNIFTQDYFFMRMEVPHMAWIASYITFFGYNYVNFVFFIPLLFGLLSLYYLFKELTNYKVALLTLLLYTTCFPVLWWFRSTAVENSSFFLLFSSLYLLVDFLQYKKTFSLVFSTLAMGIYALVRSEGFINFIIYIGIIVSNIRSDYFTNKKYKSFLLIIIALAIFLNLFVVVYFFARYQVLTTTQELPNIITHITNLITFNHGNTGFIQSTNSGSWNSNLTSFVDLILTNYGLYLPILLTLVLFLEMFKKIIKEKGKILFNYKMLFFILLIVLPNFYLLYKPQISLDQPWFLRRYYHLLIPFGYFALIYYLNKLRNNFLTILTLSILLIINIIISMPTLYPNNAGVLPQIGVFSRHVSDKALIIADGSAISLYPIAEPLYFVYGKKVIRITQESDIKYLKPIIKSYTQVFFIIDDSSLVNYPDILDNSKLIYKQNFSITRLLQTCELWGYINQTKDFYYNVCKEDGVPHQYMTFSDNVGLYSIKNTSKLLNLKF